MKSKLKLIKHSFLVLVVLLLIPGCQPKDDNKKETTSVEMKDGMINMPSGEAMEDYDIEIDELDTAYVDGDTFMSDTYVIEGKLFDVEEAIEIVFELDRDQLECLEDKDFEESMLSVVLEESVFTSSYGEVPLISRLKPDIDYDEGLVSVDICLSDLDYMEPSKEVGFLEKNLRTAVDFFSVQSEAAFDYNVDYEIKVHLFKSSDVIATMIHKDKLFTIQYNEKEVYQEWVEYVGESFLKAKAEIELLGFSFDKIKLPIRIEITTDIQESGLFVGDKFSYDKFKLVINGSSLGSKPGNKYDDEKKEDIDLVIAHELLHLVQSYYSSQTIFGQYTVGLPKPFYWLDEATATWFETTINEDKNYPVANTARNLNFINSSLVFTQDGEHGYGANVFIKYLVDITKDHKLVSKIYLKALDIGTFSIYEPNSITQDAIEELLSEEYGLELEEVWRAFTKTYLINPGYIYTWIDAYDISDVTSFLKVEQEDEQETYSVTNYNGVNKGYEISESKSRDEGLELTYKLSLGNLSAGRIRFALDPELSINPKGIITVSVKTEGDTGVMVYLNNENLLGSNTDSFLTTSINEGSVKTVTTSISHMDSLFLLPFNCDTDGEMVEREIEITLRVTPESVAKPETVSSGLADMVGTWYMYGSSLSIGSVNTEYELDYNHPHIYEISSDGKLTRRVAPEFLESSFLGFEDTIDEYSIKYNEETGYYYFKGFGIDGNTQDQQEAEDYPVFVDDGLIYLAVATEEDFANGLVGYYIIYRRVE